MVGKTNTKAKYSTCIGARYENAFVNNFETHGVSQARARKVANIHYKTEWSSTAY